MNNQAEMLALAFELIAQLVKDSTCKEAFHPREFAEKLEEAAKELRK